MRAKSRQRGEDRSCEGFRLRAGTADGGGVWSRSIELGDFEQTAQDRTTLREAEAPQTRVELGPAETEGDRGPGLVALRAPERFEDRLLLNLGQRLDDRRRARDGGRAGQAHGRGRRGRGDPEVRRR